MEYLLGIIGLVIFLYVTIDAWRSPGTTGMKILWTVFAFFCTILALIIWLIVGRKNMYGQTAV